MGINVLSLFDGMSCGQIALNKCGIEYDNYFASEIDKYAIQVTQVNYPNTKQLGSITELDGTKLPKIDLLFGGSPCQGFSFSGKQLNFEDQRSKLFFEFVRLIKECNPSYWLLENVVMKKEYEKVISEYLGVEPVKINSSLVSAQNRVRLYWANFEILQPKDKNIGLLDILEKLDFNREPYDEKYKSNEAVLHTKDKFNTLRANAGSKTRGIGICNKLGWWRKLTCTECERLQTVPENYTNYVSDSQRYKMVGNGWTVDMIAHIFKNLSNENL